MQVSIIIPVYNCEEYLEECLESVCRQTLRELEVICIDDGSLDGSYDILMQYADKDERVKVYRQANQGAGVARNYGIRVAKGKYLAFLDADDYYIDRDALEIMYQLCEIKQLQVCGSLRRNLQDGCLKDVHIIENDTMMASQGQMVAFEEVQNDYHYQSYLILRSLLIQNNIIFPSYRRFQDPPFLVKVLYAAGQFMVADTYLYCYRFSPMVARIDARKVLDLLRGLHENLNFASQHELKQLFDRTLMRVEYEYYGIIGCMASQAEEECMRILWEINRLAERELGRPDYQIRPLQFKLSQESGAWDSYEEYLCAKLREEEELYLYGAGLYAKKFISYLREHGYLHKLSRIFVTKLSEQQSVEGIEVEEFNRNSVKEDIRVYVAIGWSYQKEIAERLENENISRYLLVDNAFLSSL